MRVVANYHFFDLWESNQGYLKYKNEEGLQYLWFERVDSREMLFSKGVKTVCGKAQSKQYSQIIDINFAHSSSSIDLYFGSTLEGDACDGSYGVSNVQIYYL